MRRCAGGCAPDVPPGIVGRDDPVVGLTIDACWIGVSVEENEQESHQEKTRLCTEKLAIKVPCT